MNITTSRPILWKEVARLRRALGKEIKLRENISEALVKERRVREIYASSDAEKDTVIADLRKKLFGRGEILASLEKIATVHYWDYFQTRELHAGSHRTLGRTLGIKHERDAPPEILESAKLREEIVELREDLDKITKDKDEWIKGADEALEKALVFTQNKVRDLETEGEGLKHKLEYARRQLPRLTEKVGKLTRRAVDAERRIRQCRTGFDSDTKTIKILRAEKEALQLKLAAAERVSRVKAADDAIERIRKALRDGKIIESLPEETLS